MNDTRAAVPQPAQRRARIQLVSGVGLMIAAIAVDPLRGRPIELGAVGIAMIVVGGLAAVLAWGAGRPRVRRAVIATLVLSTVTYGCLLAIELLFTLAGPRQATRLPLEGLRGRVVEDPVVGFRNTPDWHGTQDDGIVQVEYHHNHRGDRDDDEPVAGATRRVLLLGDSFTYGQVLERDETIDRRIEARSDRTVDAYNLGVCGYSAIHSLRRFEQSDWWRGDDVVYLYFRNDLHSGSRALDYIRVYDGYAVSRRRADGTDFTDDQVRAQLTGALASRPDALGARLGAWLGLARLRRTIAAIADSELRLTAMPSSDLDPAIIDETVRHATAMRERAEAIGARFHLLILPGPVEGSEHVWSAGTTAFIAAARTAGLEPIEDLREMVERDDYVAHDGHFGPTGADKAAAVILAAVTR